MKKLIIEIYILVIFIFLCVRCDHKENFVETSILVLDHKASNVSVSKFAYDSIVISDMGDSIIFNRYLSGKPLQSFLFKVQDDIFERKIQYKNFETDFARTDSIILFSKKDTTFNYYFETDYIMLVFNYSNSSCRYLMEKWGDRGRKTLRQSLVDTTYSETFYYDHNFKIKRYENRWKNNVCIYVLNE